MSTLADYRKNSYNYVQCHDKEIEQGRYKNACAHVLISGMHGRLLLNDVLIRVMGFEVLTALSIKIRFF
jgi:hypothetical protein